MSSEDLGLEKIDRPWIVDMPNLRSSVAFIAYERCKLHRHRPPLVLFIHIAWHKELGLQRFSCSELARFANYHCVSVFLTLCVDQR